MKNGVGFSSSESMSQGGLQKAIYALHLKYVHWAHPFCTNLLKFGIMHLRFALNLLYFLLNLVALYA
jgi:hypothetical protein